MSKNLDKMSLQEGECIAKWIHVKTYPTMPNKVYILGKDRFGNVQECMFDEEFDIWLTPDGELLEAPEYWVNLPK